VVEYEDFQIKEIFKLKKDNSKEDRICRVCIYMY